MRQIELQTQQRDQFIDITSKVQAAVEVMGLTEGAIIVYVPHTTAGLVINENADPTVAQDVQADLDRLVPWDQSYYRHREGNSPSHTKASLVGSSEMVIVEQGKLQLGTWQGVFFCEFDGPRQRRVLVKAVEA